MIVKGRIEDLEDIQQRTQTSFQTGEQVVSGEFKLLVSKPTQVIDVRMSAELWKEANHGKSLEQFVGKDIDFMIETRSYSFTTQDGQSRQGSSINLFRLPTVGKPN